MINDKAGFFRVAGLLSALGATPGVRPPKVSDKPKFSDEELAELRRLPKRESEALVAKLREKYRK